LNAASAFLVRISGLGTIAGTQFGSPSGTSAANSTESNMTQLSPATDIVARDLSVKLTSAPGGVLNSRTFTLMDDAVATTITCTIIDAGTTCSSGSATATIVAGSALSIQVVNAGVPASATALLGWRATTIGGGDS